MIFQNLQRDIKRCLNDWHNIAPQSSPLHYLTLYRSAKTQLHLNTRQATNHLLLTALEKLKVTYQQEALVLERRYLDSIPVHDLANELNMADSTLYVIQRSATGHLAEIIESLEREVSTKKRNVLYQRLDAPSYIQLIGRQETVAQLVDRLRSPEPPWIISLEGIGGLGKTSLADAVMRIVVEEGLYDEIGWVSARHAFLDLGGALEGTTQAVHAAAVIIQQLFAQLCPALLSSISNQEQMVAHLRDRLKAEPHCIVIDNLETVRDVESLLPTLQDLAGPSKFILTSRVNQYAAPNIFHLKLPELDRNQTLTMARQDAALSNLPLLATAPDEELDEIFATVGGNPLAIRLVIGQSQIFSLRATLSRLIDAKGQPAENLYTYIYRQAWDSLDELGQKTLLAMPLVQPTGEPLDYIADITGIDEDTLYVGLNQLVTRNLVDVRGGLNQRLYSIHSLTRTFLHQQIIKWEKWE